MAESKRYDYARVVEVERISWDNLHVTLTGVDMSRYPEYRDATKKDIRKFKLKEGKEECSKRFLILHLSQHAQPLKVQVSLSDYRRVMNSESGID